MLRYDENHPIIVEPESDTDDTDEDEFQYQTVDGNTANGVRGSAALYSVTSTAQANGLDAEKYLADFFSHPAGTILMPWER